MFISIIVPVYNEEEVLPHMRERLLRVLSQNSVSAEVILVDDGSFDRTPELLREFVKSDARFQVLILSRNYGHQIALTAGLDHARGDVIVVLDADLQDPPELIPEMLKMWREGYHVVVGQRTERLGEGTLKKWTAALFYRAFRLLSGVDIPLDAGDFRLMDRRVVDAIKRMPERARFIRGMVAWTGFRQGFIPYERPPRAAGVTKYPWTKMVRFALDAIFSFSVVPLRLAIFLGFLVTVISMLEILRTLYLRFVTGGVIPGFSAIFITLLFLGGLILFFLGVVGEYIGRIYMEIKGRPLYIVQEHLMAQEGKH